MRCHQTLLLTALSCSLLTAGCFGSSSSGGAHDSGTLDFDSGLTTPDTSTQDATQHDASTMDALQEAAQDAPPDTAPDVVTMEDAPDDSPSATGVFSTAPVDFGLADCGGQPTPATQGYTFTNSGPLPITWSAAVGTAVFAIQGASSGTVAPGAMGSITVGVTTVPATSTAGTALGDTLTITTNVPGYGTVLVPLTVTPQGGSLTLASAIGFGSITLGSPTPLPLGLQNVGNAPVSVTLGAPTDPQFAVTYTGAPAAAAIAPGATLAGGTATFTPNATGLQSATSAITVTGVLCASPATSISMNGTGTASPLSVTPNPLNFKTVSCGSTAAPLPLTLTNANPVALPYTTALGQGASSPYQLDAPTGTIPASGQATIHVSPQSILLSANLTPGFYNDTLTVTGMGLAPVTVQLQESAGGAILALSAANTTFGTVVNTTAALPFTVTNTGNQAATVILTPPAGFTAAFTMGATAAAGGGTAPGTMSFTPTSNGAVAGSLKVSAVNECDPLPGPLGFNAVGEVPVTNFPKGQGPFAVGITCGGAATTAQFQVKNTGQSPLNIVNPLSVNGYFSFTGFTSPIGVGVTDTITVTALENNASGSAVAYADQLRFSTNEPGTPTYNVAITDLVTGVNIVVTPSTMNFATCNNVPYNVVVTGVLPAGDVATVIGNANYCVGDCGGALGFGSAFDQGGAPVSVTPGNSYPDQVYSDENSGCTPATVTFLKVTGPVCHSVLSISATYTSPGGCSNCGSQHS